MRPLLFPVLLGSVWLAAACGDGFSAGSGASGTTTAGTSSSSGTGTGTTSTSGTGGATTTSTSSTSSTSTSSTTTVTTTTTTTTTTTLTSGCPDETGTYSVTAVGMGCGDLVTTLPQCIKTGNVECQYDIVYKDMGGGQKGVEGAVSVNPFGGFTNGMIQEGSAQRSGCVGVWKPGVGTNPSTLTIDCGGIMTSQSCHVVLTRLDGGCGF